MVVMEVVMEDGRVFRFSEGRGRSMREVKERLLRKVAMRDDAVYFGSVELNCALDYCLQEGLGHIKDNTQIRCISSIPNLQ